MCKQCSSQIDEYIGLSATKLQTFQIYNLIVFGGMFGLGKIIADCAMERNMNVFRTSRTVANDFKNNMLNFDLQKPMSEQLCDMISNTNCIIFNAYQTLENDHSIWNTRLDTFDKHLAEKRYKINCFGYVDVINQLIQIRKKNIAAGEILDDMIIVFMDANESKFEEKLQDGKHLELNMAKTACKQIFYTNAQYLATFGIISICYDPGWLSYHGISVEKIEARSKYLIPPAISSNLLLSYIIDMNINECYDKKTFVISTDVYKLIHNVLKK